MLALLPIWKKKTDHNKITFLKTILSYNLCVVNY